MDNTANQAFPGQLCPNQRLAVQFGRGEVVDLNFEGAVAFILAKRGDEGVFRVVEVVEHALVQR